MNKTIGIYILAFLVISVLSTDALAAGKTLKTAGIKDRNITGEFTLYLYGNRFLDDPKTVAILAVKGTGYTFDIFAPDFDYKVIKDVPAKEALETAESFISKNSSFLQSRLTKISDDKGTIVGYELRPLYLAFTYGVEDVLDIDYKAEGKKITVWIRLIPSVKDIMSDEREKSGTSK